MHDPPACVACMEAASESQTLLRKALDGVGLQKVTNSYEHHGPPSTVTHPEAIHMRFQFSRARVKTTQQHSRAGESAMNKAC